MEPAAPVGVDLLDALSAVEAVLRAWPAWENDLAKVSNRRDAVEWFSAHVLDRHAPTGGIRSAWSVQDAVDRWGVERRDPSSDYDPGDDEPEDARPIAEWGAPIIGRTEAERIAGSESTLRRWVKAGEVLPVGTVYIAGVRTTLFRRDDVVETRDRMGVLRTMSRYRAALDEGEDR